jgi:hypothetical protein
MISVWRRFRSLISELGAVTALLYLLDRFLRKINSRTGFYYYLFVAQPLADRPRLSPARGKSFAFRVLDSPDPVLDSLGRPEAVIQGRFFQGARCLVATKNEALVGCIWYVPHAYSEDEVDADYLLPVDDFCVWDFDVFVAESERLGFLFAKLWDQFDLLLKPQGVGFTVSRINAFNQRSVASHRRLGARDCGRALFLRLGSLQLVISSEHPFFAIGGRPSLHIGPKAKSAEMS